MSVTKPAQASESPARMSPVDPDETCGYGGIGRSPFILYCIVVSCAVTLAKYRLDTVVPGSSVAAQAGAVIVFISSLALVWKRLTNIGYGGWWLLVFLGPVALLFIRLGAPVQLAALASCSLALLVGLRCVAAPEGYADHRKFDTVGRVVAFIYAGIVVALVFYALNSVGWFADPVGYLWLFPQV